MIFDSLLTFSHQQAAAASMTSTKVVDFGQADPRTGLGNTKFFIVVVGSSDFKADKVTVTVEHSADNTTFETLDVYGPVSDFNRVAIPVPAYHKRYMRLKYALTGTPAGSVSAMLTDNFNDIEKAALPID